MRIRIGEGEMLIVNGLYFLHAKYKYNSLFHNNKISTDCYEKKKKLLKA